MRIHAIWGIGQLAEADPKVQAQVVSLAKDEDSEIRAQWARIASKNRYLVNDDLLVGLLADPEPRVRFSAANALYRRTDTDRTTHELRAALYEALKTDDPYLRHAVARALGSYRSENHLREGIDGFTKENAKGGLLALQWQQGLSVSSALGHSDSVVSIEGGANGSRQPAARDAPRERWRNERIPLVWPNPFGDGP
jgi:HEAT repeat protein